jgi:hypothetical protein
MEERFTVPVPGGTIGGHVWAARENRCWSFTVGPACPVHEAALTSRLDRSRYIATSSAAWLLLLPQDRSIWRHMWPTRRPFSTGWG